MRPVGLSFANMHDDAHRHPRLRIRLLRRAAQPAFEKAGAMALSAVLALGVAFPSAALAADADGASGPTPGQDAGSPGEPPDGQGGGSMGEPPDGQVGGEGGGMGGPGGGANTQSFDYDGAYAATLSADGAEQSVDGQNIEATESLTNAALAQNAGTLSLSNSTLTKSGTQTTGTAATSMA